MSYRSDRARRRAARQRTQRIILLVFVVLVLTGLGYLAYSSIVPKQATAPVAPIPATVIGGLQIQDEVIGTGPAAKNGDNLSVHYTGWLADGTKFDSSVDRNQPFDFVLGQGNVIKGWDQGLLGMKVGGKRKLVIPPDLAYGASGAGGVIPPNATLTFEVQLLAIK